MTRLQRRRNRTLIPQPIARGFLFLPRILRRRDLLRTRRRLFLILLLLLLILLRRRRFLRPTFRLKRRFRFRGRSLDHLLFPNKKRTLPVLVNLIFLGLPFKVVPKEKVRPNLIRLTILHVLWYLNLKNQYRNNQVYNFIYHKWYG